MAAAASAASTRTEWEVLETAVLAVPDGAGELHPYLVAAFGHGRREPALEVLRVTELAGEHPDERRRPHRRRVVVERRFEQLGRRRHADDRSKRARAHLRVGLPHQPPGDGHEARIAGGDEDLEGPERDLGRRVVEHQLRQQVHPVEVLEEADRHSHLFVAIAAERADETLEGVQIELHPGRGHVEAAPKALTEEREVGPLDAEEHRDPDEQQTQDHDGDDREIGPQPEGTEDAERRGIRRQPRRFPDRRAGRRHR